MATAGQIATAGRIPGERIGITISTENIGTFTSETQVMSITVPLVQGRTYEISARGACSADASGTFWVLRIREDTFTGTQLTQSPNVHIADTSNLGYYAECNAQYVAASTGLKTFVVTALRNGGSGNLLWRSAVSGRQRGQIEVVYKEG